GGRQVDGAGGAGAVLQVRGDVQAVVRRAARGVNHVHNVALDGGVHVDAIDGPAQGGELVGAEHRLDVQLRLDGGHALQDGQLLVAAGVGELQLEHEAVELGLGQRVGALL